MSKKKKKKAFFRQSLQTRCFLRNRIKIMAGVVGKISCSKVRDLLRFPDFDDSN